MGNVIKINKKSNVDIENLIRLFFKKPEDIPKDKYMQIIDFIQKDLFARQTGDKKNISSTLTSIYEDIEKENIRKHDEFMQKSEKAKSLFTSNIADKVIDILNNCVQYNAICIPNSNPYINGNYDISITSIDRDRYTSDVDALFDKEYPYEDDSIKQIFTAYALRYAESSDEALKTALSKNKDFLDQYNGYVMANRNDNTMKEFSYMMQTSLKIIELCKSIYPEKNLRIHNLTLDRPY